MSYYAVRIGRETGIFTSWEEVAPLVEGFPGCEYRKFQKRGDALKYLRVLTEEERFRWLPSGVMRVTVDGSYNHASGKIGWAFIVTREEDKDVLHEGLGFLDDFHSRSLLNIAGELEAAKEGILFVLEELEEDLIVVQYDCIGVREWITGECRSSNNWVVKSYIRAIAHYYEDGRIVFRHVKAHEHWANILADGLAREACGLSRVRTYKKINRKRAKGGCRLEKRKVSKRALSTQEWFWRWFRVSG